MTLTDQPAVYCGTYNAYNCGSLKGKWFQLEDYADKEEFIAACMEFHKSEHDPELMFQDYQCIPAGMVSESHIDAEVWEWLKLSEEDKDMIAAYRQNISEVCTVEQVREAFRGRYDSEEDFAQEWAEETGAIKATLHWPHNCIDWEQAARELMYDFSSVDYQGKTYIFDNR